MRDLWPAQRMAAMMAATLAVVIFPLAVAGQPVASPPPTPENLSDEQRVARGEVQYGDSWVSIEELFKNYQAVQAEQNTLDEKIEAARQRLADVQQQLDSLKKESEGRERPIRTALAKANATVQDCNKVLSESPPKKPQLRALPKQPYGTSSTSSSSSSSSDDAYRNWQQLRDQIDEENKRLTDQYNRDLAEYQKKQSTAQKNLAQAKAAIKQGERQLEEAQKPLEDTLLPVLEKRKEATEEVQSLDRKATVVNARMKQLTAAFRAAPEPMRMQRGIVEWENAFHDLADLEKLHAETQAAINRVVEQMKAEAAAAGRTLSPDWRHPQQDRMDALQALIAKAKAAQAASAASAGK